MMASMKNYAWALVLVLAAGAAPSGASAAPPPLKVGVVFDVGGRGDKSFNDSAYRGVQRAKKELGVDFDFIEPGEGADRETALRQLASGADDLIFAVGFIFTDDVNSVAKDFPKKKFACVDYAVGPETKVPDNVLALKFKEEEGSYLAGALAALLSKTHVVGFVGGMDVPLIHKFEAGFRAGAVRADPKVKVLIGYAGVTPEAFKDPAKGKAIAASQFADGADILYHASGATGQGVFEAAREAKKLVIGVDSDQYHEAPGFVLTSMVKGVDVAVMQTIKDVLAGRFKSGVEYLGLKEKGVGLVVDQNNKALLPPAALKKVDALKREIVAGKIKVPSTREELAKE